MTTGTGRGLEAEPRGRIVPSDRTFPDRTLPAGRPTAIRSPNRRQPLSKQRHRPTPVQLTLCSCPRDIPQSKQHRQSSTQRIATQRARRGSRGVVAGRYPNPSERQRRDEA